METQRIGEMLMMSSRTGRDGGCLTGQEIDPTPPPKVFGPPEQTVRGPLEAFHKVTMGQPSAGCDDAKVDTWQDSECSSINEK